MGIVAKYKFDGSVYADLLPEFNEEFTDYTITDEVDSENSNHIIRTIESDSLPTLMRFGRVYVGGETSSDNRTDSLLEVVDMNTSGLTNCNSMFRYNKNLTSITCEWDTSNVTNMSHMFNNCTNLTSLDVSNFNTSYVTVMAYMFHNCNRLTSLDVSNFNTSKVTNMQSMFYNCNKLTSLDVSNFDTSSVTSMYYMFANCPKLTSIDISVFVINENTNIGLYFDNTNNLKYVKCNNINTLNRLNTLLPAKSSDNQGTIICKSDITNLDTTTLSSKYWNVVTNPTLIAKYKYDSKIYKNLIPVFNEGYMGFVENEEVDANGVVTRKIEHVELPTLMRFGSNLDTYVEGDELALLEILDMNTSGLTSCYRMFRYCKNLTSIICNWDTSDVTTMYHMFYGCIKLTTLDISNFNTSNVTNMGTMFYKCNKLTTLDVSNFNISNVTNTTNMFNNTLLLTDIGMIYCDQSTINKVASLLPTDHNITIWVESDDILQYDQYDHITYKTQKVQDTVHLNSPLLMGDTIEVIDGKTYHVHRYEKVVLDGSENWMIGSNDDKIYTYRFVLYLDKSGISRYDTPIYSDTLKTKGAWNDYEHIWINEWDDLNVHLNVDKIESYNLSDFQQWLSENPTTVVYELATPYYELISEEPLELTLLDTADNTINNNSILPSNMTIANKELSTIAIKPSTTYTLAFDKSIEDSEVTIDICGGEQITTVLNRIELTTPSELGSGIRFISSDGCIISNVRLLEGSLVESAIPKETFEGLQSSFDEGYIIGDNLANFSDTFTIYGDSNVGYAQQSIPLFKNINKPVTVVFTISNKVGSNTLKVRQGVSNGTIYDNNSLCNLGNGIHSVAFVPSQEWLNFQFYYSVQEGDKSQVTISNVMIFEGDHTHLSEAELMRYIEKGTSHYEEEDFNHVGKYKVEYKVTGKNKFDVNTMTPGLRGYTELISYDNGEWVLKQTGGYPGLYFNFDNIEYFKGRHWITKCDISTTNSNSSINCQLRGLLPDGSSYYAGADANYFIPENAVTVQLSIIFHNKNEFLEDNIATISNIQIEEGTVATEYEPYKEDIKTYYLSSPLLKGDTIDDINGVATHVKRYKKVVLDGSSDENWRTYEKFTNATTIESLTTFSSQFELNDNGWSNTVCYSDKFPTATSMNDAYWRQRVCLSSGYNQILICQNIISDLNEFKQWLQANPTTIVYELKTPIYEPISDKSILCDSYVNGHLDVDSAVPIEKVKFDLTTLFLKYSSSNSTYIFQFESDNNGYISHINLGGINYNIKKDVMKGLNKILVSIGDTPNSTLFRINGIGFNASNIQVVATDKEFGYFKGLQSSFEDGLVTDENDENYGKYKVEVKIVGKNKFHGELLNGSINNDFGELTFSTGALDSVVSVNPIKVMPETTYTISNDLNYSNYIYEYDFNMNYLNYYKFNDTSSFTTLNNTCYVRVRSIGSKMQNDLSVKYQLEEGTQATSYEPYKESIHTLYLNSPLLKGDKIVVHDGKLCHYHKMSMVVLDGSEKWTDLTYTGRNVFCYEISKGCPSDFKDGGKLYSDTKSRGGERPWIGEVGLAFCRASQQGLYAGFAIADEGRAWIKNPTTVVYELAEPYYEPIEPQLSQYSFSTVKDGDMEIITVLPIEKINLTYRTDINGVSSIEEQIASIQEGTDISSIIDEEVDE